MGTHDVKMSGQLFDSTDLQYRVRTAVLIRHCTFSFCSVADRGQTVR